GSFEGDAVIYVIERVSDDWMKAAFAFALEDGAQAGEGYVRASRLTPEADQEGAAASVAASAHVVYAEEGGVAVPVVNFLGAGTQPDGDEEGDGKAQDGDLSETVETIGREGIVTHNDVNLRAGPAKRYDILLVKQKGDSVFVRHAQTGEDGAAWY